MDSKSQHFSQKYHVILSDGLSPCFPVLLFPPKLTWWSFGLPWKLTWLGGWSLQAGAESAVTRLDLGTSELCSQMPIISWELETQGLALLPESTGKQIPGELPGEERLAFSSFD